MMNDDVVTTQTGMMETAKDYFNPQTLLEKMNLSKQRLIELGMYFGIGFLLGFLVKKYSKFLFAAAVTLASLVVLQQFEIITLAVNWDRVQDVFGIQTPTLEADLFTLYWEWIKVNVTLVLSLSLGFIIGLKVA